MFTRFLKELYYIIYTPGLGSFLLAMNYENQDMKYPRKINSLKIKYTLPSAYY